MATWEELEAETEEEVTPEPTIAAGLSKKISPELAAKQARVQAVGAGTEQPVRLKDRPAWASEEHLAAVQLQHDHLKQKAIDAISGVQAAGLRLPKRGSTDPNPYANLPDIVRYQTFLGRHEDFGLDLGEGVNLPGSRAGSVLEGNDVDHPAGLFSWLSDSAREAGRQHPASGSEKLRMVKKEKEAEAKAEKEKESKEEKETYEL